MNETGDWIFVFIVIIFTFLGTVFYWLKKFGNLISEYLSEKIRQIKLDNDLKEQQLKQSKNNTNQ